MRCLSASDDLVATRAVAFFEGPLRRAVHRLKYRCDRGLAEALAGPMAEVLAGTAWRPTRVVPVPLSAQRMAERGYNQSALLAERVAERLDLCVDDTALVRVKDTPAQVLLSAEARRHNVRGAFQPARAGVLAGERVVVVDDVHTTGATLEACASAVRAGGAACVWGLTLARAR